MATPDRNDVHHAPEVEFEEQLRVLLGRGVPELTAPPDRMSRVLHRVLRFRRRRAAALTAAGTVAAVCAALLLPRTAPGSPASAPPAARPAASSTARGPVARTTVNSKVSLPLSGTWHLISGKDLHSAAHAFLVNRPGAGDTFCKEFPDQDGPCVPITRLAPGEGMVWFVPGGQPAAAQGNQAFDVGAPSAAGHDCRIVGGTHELFATGRDHGAAAASSTLSAHVCVRAPQDQALAEIVQILALATFTEPARPMVSDRPTAPGLPATPPPSRLPMSTPPPSRGRD